MQPSRFARELLDWICADTQVLARSFTEAGYPDAPFGVQVRLPSGAVVHLQAIGTAASGFTAGGPADGAPPPVADPVLFPAEGPTELVSVERWLAWRITQAQSAQIKSVELFQHRTGRRSIPHGVAVTFHSGDRVWLYVRHATPAGRQPGAGPIWRALPAV